jgi:hypothetical protein
MQHHKYDIGTLENLLPFERDLYFEMLVQYIKRQEEEKRSHQNG